jgi:hypothetical protein
MRSLGRAHKASVSATYILALTISALTFAIIWSILHAGEDETAWITAAVVAVCVLVILLLLGKLFLVQRPRRKRSLTTHVIDEEDPAKLTVERNAALLAQIKQKSDAANVLNKLSAAHGEVIDLCKSYLAKAEGELSKVQAGSPRLAPILRGRNAVSELHRYHTLRWAEIESKHFTGRAQTRADLAERVAEARSALRVIDVALEHYPAEKSLLESRQVVLELIDSISIAGSIEDAERAVFEGDLETARTKYLDALLLLERRRVPTKKSDETARQVRTELQRLTELQSKM